MMQQFPAIYEDGVFKPLVPLDIPEHQRVMVSVSGEIPTSNQANNAGDESFLEAASRLGFVGSIKGTPPDLSTNKRHMEGFGGCGT
jgi:predicted DNA-binding antitoxin AbrB/MazE fold protein